MIRTIGTLAATVALVAGTAAAASATTTTTTETRHGTAIDSAIPVTCVGPGITSFVGTGHWIQHLTINKTGGWFTTTTEGQVTLWTTTLDGQRTSWTGHVQEWFGDEDNLNNSVEHATFNFQGVSTTDPSKSLTIHAAFTATTNANGVLVVNNETVNCT